MNQILRLFRSHRRHLSLATGHGQPRMLRTVEAQLQHDSATVIHHSESSSHA